MRLNFFFSLFLPKFSHLHFTIPLPGEEWLHFPKFRLCWLQIHFMGEAAVGFSSEGLWIKHCFFHRFYNKNTFYLDVSNHRYTYFLIKLWYSVTLLQQICNLWPHSSTGTFVICKITFNCFGLLATLKFSLRMVTQDRNVTSSVIHIYIFNICDFFFTLMVIFLFFYFPIQWW